MPITGSFFVYDWVVESDEDETIIRMYGIDQKDRTVCVRIRDFCPWIYIELPERFFPYCKNEQLNDAQDRLAEISERFMRKIQEQIPADAQPTSAELVFRKKLYYAHLDKNGERKQFPFFRCRFQSIQHIRRAMYRIKKIRIDGFVFDLKVHETDANPVLQLTSLQKLPTAGWISFRGRKIDSEDQETRCDREFSCLSWKSLRAIERDYIPTPTVMSFDIETYSHDSSMPKASRRQNVIFQISCVFSSARSDKYEKYLLTLYNADSRYLEKGTILREYDTEGALIIGLRDLIIDKCPHIIIGYNIFQFDIPYIVTRAQSEIDVFDEFADFGLKQDKMARTEEIKWSSSAYKNQEFQVLISDGRVFIDLLPIVRRDHKLSNYRLETVAQKFLGAGKDPLDYKGIFRCYELGQKRDAKGRKALGIVGKYCVQDSALVLKLFDFLNIWVGLSEMARVCNVEIFTLFTRGQQIKVFSQIYRDCTRDGFVVEKDGYECKEDENYVGAKVFPPKPGLYNLVCPFDFSSLYPTTMIAYNICMSTLVIDQNIPDEMCHVMEWEDHVGCDHDPKIIARKKLDQKIKANEVELKNMRQRRDAVRRTKQEKEAYQKLINEKKEEAKSWREERKELVKTKPKRPMCAHRRYRWLKEPIGVLPGFLKNLLDARKIVKSDMKRLKGELEKIEDKKKRETMKRRIEVLNAQQLALKVSANSVYGSTGVKRGYLPFMPAAMCTTFKGREAVQKAAYEIVTKYGGKFVYGDTDSNYVYFSNLTNPRECWDYAIDVAKKVTEIFPKPMNLEFESTIYHRFMILTKKRYLCTKTDSSGVVSADIEKKGVLLSRRDNCEFIRRLYRTVITQIFDGQKSNVVINYIIDEINKLCSGFYPYTDFIITKSVGDDNNLQVVEIVEDGKIKGKVGDYKVPLLPKDKAAKQKQFHNKDCDNAKEYYLRCLPAQVQLAHRMRQRGQLVSAGSRLEYVITTNGGPSAKQFVKIESAEYFKRHRSVLRIDYLYYLKQLTNPLDQVLNVIYRNKVPKNFVQQQYKFRYGVRRKIIEELEKYICPSVFKIIR